MKSDSYSKLEKCKIIEVDLKEKVDKMNEKLQVLGLQNDEEIKKINKERKIEVD